MWFPDTVLEVSRDDDVCPSCQPHPVHMLKFKFKRGSLPPGMPLEFAGCIGGCDETLREVLNLKYLREGGGGDSRNQVNHSSASLQSNRPVTNPAPRSRSDTRPPVNRPPVNTTPALSLQPSETNQNQVCNCGQDAVLLTVRKEGPNQGRQFYKCNTGNCNFFLWDAQQNDQSRSIEQPGPSSQHPRPSLGFMNTPQQRQGSSGSLGGGEESMCNCNEPAVTRTVMKDGPNKGKVFLTCSKPRDQQCGFFQWVDENVAPAAVGNVRGNNSKYAAGRKKQASSSKASTSKRPRTCGICHQPGHTRTNCPQAR